MLKMVITYEPDDEALPNRLPTRKELAQQLGCHYNTLRNDELLIKQCVDDAQKYYHNPDPQKLEAVELNLYLIWLLIQVRDLRKQGKSKDSVAFELFQESDKYSEKGYQEYVKRQSNRQNNRANAA